MSKKHKVFWLVVVLGGVIGLGKWIFDAGELSAADAFPAPLAFQSPIGNPVLTLDKKVNNAAPKPGDLISYGLTYANIEPGARGFNLRLYDFLPAGLEYVGANPGPDSVANGILLFTATNTDQDTVTIYARVREGYTELNNRALVLADGVDPVTTALSIPVTPLIDRLDLTVDGYKAVIIGGEVVHRIRCENTGESTLEQVILVNFLPEEVTVQEMVTTPDLDDFPMAQWEIGTLAPGEIWEGVITSTAPSSPTVLHNRALLYSAQTGMTQTIYSTQVITEGAILQIDKRGPQAVNVGDTLRYRLDLTNIGNVTATNVLVTDTFPANIQIVDYDPITATVNDTRGIWEIDAVAPGSVERVIITATVGLPGNRTLVNMAEIGSSGSWGDEDELTTTVKPLTIYLPVVTRF
ncbi:MAG: DUF11 domain-containing protein [Anaerolineales bacterium]